MEGTVEADIVEGNICFLDCYCLVGPTALSSATYMFGSKAVFLTGSLQPNLEVNSSFSSSRDFLTGSSGSVGVAVPSALRGKTVVGFFTVLKSMAVDSDEDLAVSSSFSSSIALYGSFRLVRLFFFFLLTGSSSEDKRDSSESYSVAAGVLFFFFFFGTSVSDSDSDSDSDSEEPNGSYGPSSLLLSLVDFVEG